MSEDYFCFTCEIELEEYGEDHVCTRCSMMYKCGDDRQEAIGYAGEE